jgi:hypothetical protein
MANLFKPQIVRYLDAEGKRVKKSTPGARKVKEKASKWWGKYRDPTTGKEERVPLFTDKKASQQRLNDLVKQAERAKVGLTDPKFEEHAQRPSPSTWPTSAGNWRLATTTPATSNSFFPVWRPCWMAAASR